MFSMVDVLETKLTIQAEKEYLQKTDYKTKRNNVRKSVSSSCS